MSGYEEQNRSMQYNTITKAGENTGSVLVITILITAVLLAIGITMASILERDIVRQAYGRQSQSAMNIANSALECVLFNDFRRHTFQTLLARKYDVVACGELYQVRKGSDWSITYKPSSDESSANPAGTGTYQFVIIDSAVKDLVGVSRVPCAHITVKKVCAEGVKTGTTICEEGLIESSIEIKGYNSCSSGETEVSRGLVRRFKVYY